MKRMSFSETVFLFVLALIIFGPKKLPEIARQVGKYMNEFKRASNEFKAQIEQEISNLEVDKRQTILPPSPPPEGATSRTPYAASLAAGADAPAPDASAPQAHALEGSTVGVAAAAVASDDEPLFAAGAIAPSSVASPAAASPDEVTPPTTPPTTQESHV